MPDFFFKSSVGEVVFGHHRRGLTTNGAISTHTGAVALVDQVLVEACCRNESS